jgi:hypothetical protein
MLWLNNFARIVVVVNNIKLFESTCKFPDIFVRIQLSSEILEKNYRGGNQYQVTRMFVGWEFNSHMQMMDKIKSGGSFVFLCGCDLECKRNV